MLAHQDALLNLCLLDISLFAHGIDASFGLLADHLVVLHLLHLLLHLLIVALLELHDFAGALASLLNLLPRLELLLLEQGDAIGEELGIAFHTRNSSRYSQRSRTTDRQREW
jgi:hypothetical protein